MRRRWQPRRRRVEEAEDLLTINNGTCFSTTARACESVCARGGGAGWAPGLTKITQLLTC